MRHISRRCTTSNMDNLNGFHLLIFLMISITLGNAISCDRTFDHLGPKRPGDNGFRIRIERQPDDFTPGESYQITLQSTPPMSFKWFMVIAVSEDGEPVGVLEILDPAQSMLSELCPHAVTQSNVARSKTSVTFQWTAPTETDGTSCVTFKASAVHRKKIWFMDDDNLSVRLCERVATATQPDESTVQSECCACSIAEYEVSFYGQWTIASHPRDYPSGNGNHWSDLIGATHSDEYLMWEDGGYASEGVKRLAQWGTPVGLEREMRLQGSNIRSVIKHRGLWPAVGNMTSMLMEVDRRRNLVSALSMIGPSPDWLVGISNENMCTTDCGWQERMEYGLLPWDAGTDSGITYMSRNVATIPAERMHRLTTRYPDDEANPFFDPAAEEVTPLARLVLQRISVTEASCDDAFDETNTDTAAGGHGDGGTMMKKPGMDGAATAMPPKQMPTGRYVIDCMMSEWGDFGECTKSCGKGRMIRTRMIKRRAKNGGETCGPRKQSKKCMMEVCPRDCMMMGWSDWSDCSVSCGEGVQLQTRRIKRHSKGTGVPCGDVKQMRACEMAECG